MAELRLTEEAQSDLKNIRAIGIETFGEAVARRHLLAIREAFIFLSEHPFAGQGRPEFRGDMRSFSRPPHRILFTVNGGTVLIVRVIHQARDMMAVLLAEP